MQSRVSRLVGSATLAFICACFIQSSAAETVRIEPKEIPDLLPNPGMGWQTFGQFADSDKNLQGLPSSSAYFRFYWREIEPEEGKIDFIKLDDLLAHAHRAGQRLALRVMCTGSGEYMDVPEWLKGKGCAGVEFAYGDRKHWVPDFADPRFKEAHFRLIRELGKRYDRHPDMDLLDIGSVGLWGEWHMSGTDAGGKPVPLPPVELRLDLIRAWCNAFPTSSKVILIGSEEGMRQTYAWHYGWRADCLGDMGGFSKTWNHMDNSYLQQLEKTGAADAWTNAPVAFESCWDMRKWKDSNWDIRYIFDYALKCHASYINNKSAPLPAGTREEVERVLRRLGYRLVLRSLEHADAVAPGSDLAVKLTVENVGVAPPYRDYVLAVRFAPVNNNAEGIVARGPSIRGWLPGKRDFNLMVKIPPNASPGAYSLAAGVLNPDSGDPAVRLAIAGRSPTGWYPLSKVAVN